jgi:hypothetical protein
VGEDADVGAYIFCFLGRNQSDNRSPPQVILLSFSSSNSFTSIVHIMMSENLCNRYEMHSLFRLSVKIVFARPAVNPKLVQSV